MKKKRPRHEPKADLSPRDPYLTVVAATQSLLRAAIETDDPVEKELACSHAAILCAEASRLAATPIGRRACA